MENFSMKNEIFKLLITNNVPFEGAETILSQCLNFMKNTGKLGEVVHSLGLELSRFRQNEALEFYYDIKKDGEDLAYISKGWEDPGFRLGELIIIPFKDLNIFRQNSDKILNICSTQVIACGVNATPKSELQLDLTIPIYQDGLTAKTLKDALDTMKTCVTKIKAFFR
ncbi:MAG: hypothetical protein HY811_02530 [Planctomycetes bacterium]|nr:hypothetical protein [Planctomycetota bacterium]